ncbi:MAG: hypothetical protein A2358_02750 [Candidatus Staskawiczbacteria bacterium RIFOXYB1_FULL_37_44]|uniref:Restriction endonuclease n=1 Tax=Candidatus Staskawiczbacteria bacterium RIFOXYB1_FULL_37_44 TaxID=1802223 RepID=A0A1G2IWZ6_9BACT|nr:MAG: hypothetical protein A2358_02750 [Candidatus Staskawiczbacteria bacterium RIFOXYB1_FULL_37_44]OGZ83845.1 MAG: hypothetical protein A2416_02465 [Candidatus Staskawiczbacteria bacterium RIFOXYC1_FULL_37_52]OGZ87788.1 MAG: hypothetical protein A2444_02845 [Candidatus Staskawiczbacteria bacterium RIFOXYC2_FULL_37_19]OGZ89352.1 MAG: hypothetical protein A2581_00525 [Candidatus Staskawiczbacteria bacterium RIFOXYD1_FULL_37_110]
MNNQQFLQTIGASLRRFLQTHSRSNEKLKVLHAKIAEDIQSRLGNSYMIKSLGTGDGKEGEMIGRYIDKTVDIIISKDGKNLAGIGVKFVMNNYSQNSNNYFENMLGETANIRANKGKYFQVFVLPEEMPYYDNTGKIQKWEKVTVHNIKKYIALSNDNTDTYLHTPIKTLLFIVKFPACDLKLIKTREKYKKCYLKNKNIEIQTSNVISGNFGDAIILNDYNSFAEKVVYNIKSI